MAPEEEKKSIIPAEMLESIAQANRKRDKRFYGSKLSIIDDLCFSLMHSDEFLKELEEIREKYHIPHLDVYRDMAWARKHKGRWHIPASQSIFWEEQGNEKEKSFDKDIRLLIDTYEYVPQYLAPWIRHVAMYRTDQLAWEPKRDISSLIELIRERNDISKMPLNDRERDYFMLMARNVLGYKYGRPTQDIQEMLARVRQVLTVGKTKFRRMQIKSYARKVLSMREEYSSYHDIADKLFSESSEILDSVHDDHVNNAKRMLNSLRKRMGELTKKKVGK